MKVLITGSGSVMGQSIYKAVALYRADMLKEIHFANSESISPGKYFNLFNAPVIRSPIFPLAVDEHYSDFLEEYVEINEIDIVFSGTQHELIKIAAFRDKSLKAATLSSQFVNICTNKILTYQTLAKHGVASSYSCSLDSYLSDCNIEGAVIIKPNESSSSRNIFHFESFKHAKQFFALNSFDTTNFLVQPKLTGDEYTCGCYIDRYSQSVNHITFKRKLTSDGATSYGEIVHNHVISSYIQNIADAFTAEGIDFGHFNVQLILTSSGPILFEINGRLSSTEASKAHYGFNSVAAYITNIVDQCSYDKFCVPEYGRFLRYYEEVYF